MPKYTDVPGPMLALFLAMTTNHRRNDEFRNRAHALATLGIDAKDFDDMVAAMDRVAPELQKVRDAFLTLDDGGTRWSPDCPSAVRIEEVAEAMSETLSLPLEQPQGVPRFDDVPANMLAHWLAMTTNDALAAKYKVESQAKADLEMTSETFAIMMRHVDADPDAVQTLTKARALFLKIAEAGAVWSPDCPRGSRLQQVATRLDKVAGEP